ncbi:MULTISPECIES: DUF2946 family protein [unclassified Sinorhizobium]|uniref:DUF2946 family protein n=1 Tax=unclassified Sinorhizobium TaxID=2613772 RepID=UPI003525FE8A
MKIMRLLLRDRVSAGAIAVLVAYLLLLQGALSGMAQATVAASAVDSLHVLCSSSGIAADPANNDGAPAKKALDCPCGTLCRLASTAMPAILDGQTGVIPIATPVALDVHFPANNVFLPALRGLIGEPRAPPVSI